MADTEKTRQTIETLLRQQFSPTFIEVKDESAHHVGHAGAKQSGGGHFALTIVADAFTGLTKVQRHREIYAALGNEIGTSIHALSIQAFAPNERK